MYILFILTANALIKHITMNKHKLTSWLYCCSFLRMAPGCCNMKGFFVCIMCIVSQSTYFGKYIDYNFMFGLQGKQPRFTYFEIKL